MTKAAMTPGTHPQNVKSNTIRKEPQPLPITDKGGKTMAKRTRMKLIVVGFFDWCTNWTQNYPICYIQKATFYLKVIILS